MVGFLGTPGTEHQKMSSNSLGKAKLTYEELLTVVMEIEGVLNLRPLC